ncbi:ATP-binding protein [Streptomyces bobili]|uniref:ATP-binding protein n=1 Tax=Streptomyces bobili TaxID=67280 RepID=UPI002254E3E0|nr:ATP-binding protein [Streptomyces bobili]MCX5524249.1 ATP-binding protein [Streptomyces bobili]
MSARPASQQRAEPGMSEIECRLPHSLRSARHARELLRGQLAVWKLDGEVALTAELLLSELVTNSLRHARVPVGREIGVRIATYDGRLRVEVADANDSRPEVREPTDEDEQGRGLALVEALALRWGCCPRRHGIGKATWVELALP